MNAVVKNLVLNGSKALRCKKVDEILSYIEEQLTSADCEEVRAFLTWSFENNKTFGWGNIDDRVREFEEAKSK